MWRQSNPFELPFTSLHRLEVRNAFFLSAFRGKQTKQDAVMAWQGVESDVAAMLLEETGLPFADVLREAESMVAAHTFETGARSLDILHVASAALLGVSDFVTFDKRQAALVGRVGLRVVAI